jgi:hypothetical protein
VRACVARFPSKFHSLPRTELISPRAAAGLEPFPPHPGAPWNGVGGATSADGVHFVDQGVLFSKDPRAIWLGSGSVLRNAAGEYVMNFSEDYDCGSPSCQSIFFATSKDLKNWTRLPFAPPPAADPNVFKHLNDSDYKANGRWDCIATVPKPGSPGHFIGYWRRRRRRDNRSHRLPLEGAASHSPFLGTVDTA